MEAGAPAQGTPPPCNQYVPPEASTLSPSATTWMKSLQVEHTSIPALFPSMRAPQSQLLNMSDTFSGRAQEQPGTFSHRINMGGMLADRAKNRPSTLVEEAQCSGLPCNRVDHDSLRRKDSKTCTHLCVGSPHFKQSFSDWGRCAAAAAR
jgi:hypothetical protein